MQQLTTGREKRRRPPRGGLALAVVVACLVGTDAANAASVASVQRGSLTLPDGTGSANVTLSTAVDPATAFLVFGVAGDSGSPRFIQVSGQITDGTTLTFARFATTGTVDVLWYVTDFDSGVAVQRGSASLPNSIPADLDIALTSVDLTKSFPLISLRNSGNDFDGSDFARAKIVEDGVNDGGTPCSSGPGQCLRLSVPVGDATKIVEWQVVEYQDAVVQTNDISFTDTDQTLTDAVTSVNTDKAWLLFNYECGPGRCNTDISNIAGKMFRGIVQNDTTLEFSRLANGASGDVVELTWYLVEFTDRTTVRHGIENLSTSELMGPDTLNPEVRPSTSIALGGGSMRGGRTNLTTSDNAGHGWFTYDITTPSEIVTTRGATGSVASAGWFVIDFFRDPTEGHHLVYATNESVDDTPRVRTLSTPQPAWSAEARTTTATANVNWIVSAQAPTRDEEIAVVFSDAPRIHAQRWNGTAWSADWSTAGGLVAGNATRRGIAVAYEQSSGDAIVVYTNNSANPRYRTWNGSSWSSAANVFSSAPGTGEVRWVELASDPTSDRVALVYSDGQSDVHAAIWNGTAWDQTTKQTLTTSGASYDYRDVDLAYEASGDLMVVHARSDGFDWWTMASGTTTWVDGGHIPLVGGFIAYVDVAAEPGTDRIALVGIDENNGTERLGAATWTGAGWFNSGEYVSGVPHWETDGPGPFWAAVQWRGTAGEAVIAFSDFTAGEIGWMRWTDTASGWVVQPDEVIPGSTAHIRSMELDIVPGFDRIVAVFSDEDGDLRSAGYGGTWDVRGVLDAELPTIQYKPFSLATSITVPTAVELTSFEATAYPNAVMLEWKTGSELDNLGFHLYRATSSDGPYERITSRLIPGLVSSAAGARYQYRDDAVTGGETYYYELEDVETTGQVARHGPVSATPGGDAPSEEPAENGDDDAFEGPRLTYGDPSANALRVVKRGRRHVVVELTTAGFYAYPEPDGTVRIEVPGFAHEDGRLPTRQHWVEALAGRRVDLLSVREALVETFGLRPAVGQRELTGSADGVTQLTPGRSRSGPSASAAVQILDVAFQGEVKKALVQMAPLSWNATSEEMRLAKKLYVTLSLARPDAEETAGGNGDGRTGRRKPSGSTRWEDDVLARLATREAGLHAVRFEAVFGSRYRRSLPADELRLSRHGEAVAFRLAPDAAAFGPGSTLYFVGGGGYANPYGNEAVYELARGGEGRLTMAAADAAPSGAAVSSYLDREAREENNIYHAGLLEADDPWLWDTLFAPAEKTYRFAVDALESASDSEPAHVALWLHGGTDLAAVPDHHVTVSVNGVFVAEARWSGKQPRKIEAEVDPRVLRDGVNVLEVENVGDTEARFSMVYLDRWAVTYPREARAREGKLEGTFTETGLAEVIGFSTEAIVLDTTESTPGWVGAVPVETGSARFPVEAGHRYLAVETASALTPEVRFVPPPRFRLATHRADYLVIGPEAFLDAAAPLLQHRSTQGLATLAVPVEAVFEEFGAGERRPEAIRDFLTYAYHEWRSPSPRYVLLLGDASFDFKDYYGTGVENHMPPLMLETRYLRTASDPSYAAVNGDDLLPDLAIGRLSVRNVAEVNAVVNKILDYENGTASLGAPVLLVTDNKDAGGNFDARAGALASTVLAAQATRRVSLGDLGVATARQAVLDGFDDGASVVSYIGHGGIDIWASERLLQLASVDALQPQAQQPIVLTMNCLNGYFHFPFFDALSEALVRAEDKGAIAAFSPSGLSLDEPAHRYHEAVLQHLFHGAHARLGDVILAAQEDYTASGALPELLSIYHLFGDPALALR